GFAGIGMAAQLKRRGETSFLVLERAGDVGGTWRDNDYPGVACDVPSHLYSFSFHTKPDWSRVFAPGEEIQQYLRDVTEKEGLTPHLRFDHEMTACRWNEDELCWHVSTGKDVFKSRFLITACGHLADEHVPNVEGIESYKGTYFHSS